MVFGVQKCNRFFFFQFQRGYEGQRHVPRDSRRDHMGYNMYTSEPDLRFTDSRQPPPMGFQYQYQHGDSGVVKGGRMSRSKKKYRAPQVPPAPMHHNGVSVVVGDGMRTRFSKSQNPCFENQKSETLYSQSRIPNCGLVVQISVF